jgi:Tfp pilus assembly protein PilF
MLLLASMLMGEKQYAEALATLKKVQELAPQNPQSYSMSAAIYNQQNKLEQALAQYKALLGQNPKNIQALMGIGALLEQQGDSKGAKEQYRKVLTIRPDFAAAANNLAWLIAEEPEPDLGEALRLAMIAKEQLPDEVHIIDTLGWVHYKRKAYSLARNEFAQAVEKQPDMPILRYHLALALYGEGKHAQAIKEMETALTGKGDFKNRQEAQSLLEKWRNEPNE